MSSALSFSPQQSGVPGRLLLLLLWKPGSRLEQRLRPIADIVVVVGWTAAQDWLERESFDAVVCEVDDLAELECAKSGLRGRNETVLCVAPANLVSEVSEPLLGVHHGPALSNEIVAVLRRADVEP